MDFACRARNAQMTHLTIQVESKIEPSQFRSTAPPPLPNEEFVITSVARGWDRRISIPLENGINQLEKQIQGVRRDAILKQT